VTAAERQDRILEAKLLRLRAPVHLEPEESGVAVDGGLEVPHHNRQLDYVSKYLVQLLLRRA